MNLLDAIVQRPGGCVRSGHFVICIVIVSGFMAAAMGDSPCLSLSRTASAMSYESGQDVVFELTLQNNCAEAITSLGISEVLPEGWQFISGEAISGAAPVQWLAPGSANRLEIFWITVPEFPVVLRYTAKAPETEAGPALFSGYAIFSFTTGNQQNSDVVETTLIPFVVDEGEGETAEGEVVEGESEGEAQVEGEPEGEALVEGEGAPEVENEGEGEDEGAPVGCCRRQPTTKTANSGVPAGDGLLFAGVLFILVVPRRVYINFFPKH